MMEPETYAGMQAQIHEIATQGFAQHELTETGPNEWRCGRPNSGYYGFRVIVRPSMVVIWGDLGEAVFRGGEAGDTLGWLRRAAYSPSYLLSKWRTGKKELYPGDVLDYLRERAADGEDGQWGRWYRELLDEAEELQSNHMLNEHTWQQLAYETTGDSELCCAGMNYAIESFWFVEALRWLVEHLPAEVEAEAETPIQSREAVAA